MTKILLVDDSKFLRMASERALSRAGYTVITADEGGKAVELAKKETPDVILLDMLLPGMTGPDVLKLLKKDPSTAAIPVIAFTGLSNKNEGRLRQDGACAYLEKSTLGLDKGCDTLLKALEAILRELGLKVPAPLCAQGATGS
jgi:CheY-like chemotaxis protein